MSSVARICAYIDSKKIRKSEFYQKTGLSNGYLDKVKDLGAEKIESIISAYPDLNLTWLITGEGDMIIEYRSITPPPIQQKSPVSLQRGAVKGVKEALVVPVNVPPAVPPTVKNGAKSVHYTTLHHPQNTMVLNEPEATYGTSGNTDTQAARIARTERVLRQIQHILNTAFPPENG